jgi:hypothetical protein
MFSLLSSAVLAVVVIQMPLMALRSQTGVGLVTGGLTTGADFLVHDKLNNHINNAKTDLFIIYNRNLVKLSEAQNYSSNFIKKIKNYL